MTRVLLFTGKGGTGKTTCAAATALAAAAIGHRTLVLSTDPAHSLADAFDVPLGPEPTRVSPNLDAQEVDLYYSMRKYWSNMRDLMRMVARWQGIDAIAAEELAALPGMAEGSALLWLDHMIESAEYDLIVVDSAPTGETLTFLTLPQATEWWLTRAFPFQKLALRTIGAAVRKTTGVPLDRGYAELRHLFDRLKSVQSVLADPAVTSVRLVLNPEKMVIREAVRAYTYLQLYGYGVDAAIVNRVMPEDDNPRWGEYMEKQREYLIEIEDTFSPLPVLRVPHQLHEVFGIDALRHIASSMYEGDPAALMYTDRPFRIEPEGKGFALVVRAPNTSADRITLRQTGDQLVIQLEGQRRVILLPHFLAYYRNVGHHYQDGELTVHYLQPTEESNA